MSINLTICSFYLRIMLKGNRGRRKNEMFHKNLPKTKTLK